MWSRSCYFHVFLLVTSVTLVVNDRVENDDRKKSQDNELFSDYIKNISKVNHVLQELIHNYEHFQKIYKTSFEPTDVSTDSEIDEIFSATKKIRHTNTKDTRKEILHTTKKSFPATMILGSEDDEEGEMTDVTEKPNSKKHKEDQSKEKEKDNLETKKYEDKENSDDSTKEKSYIKKSDERSEAKSEEITTRKTTHKENEDDEDETEEMIISTTEKSKKDYKKKDNKKKKNEEKNVTEESNENDTNDKKKPKIEKLEAPTTDKVDKIETSSSELSDDSNESKDRIIELPSKHRDHLHSDEIRIPDNVFMDNVAPTATTKIKQVFKKKHRIEPHGFSEEEPRIKTTTRKFKHILPTTKNFSDSPKNVQQIIHLESFNQEKIWADIADKKPIKLRAYKNNPSQTKRAIPALKKPAIIFLSKVRKRERAPPSFTDSEQLTADDTKDFLKTSMLRQAYGDACLKVVVKKCFKALKSVMKTVCRLYKCKSDFKSEFTENSKTGCIEKFRTGSNGNKTNDSNSKNDTKKIDGDNDNNGNKTDNSNINNGTKNDNDTNNDDNNKNNGTKNDDVNKKTDENNNNNGNKSSENNANNNKNDSDTKNNDDNNKSKNDTSFRKGNSFKDITRSGLSLETCYPLMADTGRENIAIPLTPTTDSELQLNILRDRYEKECQKASAEKCTEACAYAYEKACGTDDCKSKMVSAFSKQCKRQCKSAYVNKRAEKKNKSSDSVSSASSSSESSSSKSDTSTSTS